MYVYNQSNSKNISEQPFLLLLLTIWFHTIDRANCMIDNEMIEEKIGEVLGLEMAAQKAVEQLVSKGLLDKSEIKQQVEEIRKEAHNHQTQLEELCERLSKSKEQKIDSENVKDVAAETEQKASKMMSTYLGDDADTSEALEFLCIAEGGEVAHYEVLDAMVNDINDSEFKNKVKSILNEEKEHLQECIKLARENIA
jgi:ferritin-like metal-binding protein YciE